MWPLRVSLLATFTRIVTLTKFSELGLPERLVHKLDAMNLTQPTPIQERAIPVALEGGDVMGLAQTGTGKTMAFGLPLVKTLLDQGFKPAPKSVRSLILAPTRELARQICDALGPLTQRTPLKAQMVVGGASITAQVKRLSRGADILVATPGRLLDLIDRRAVNLDDTRFLVLDEADQMLDLGFVHALRQLAKLLPVERQTMLFSATMPKHMDEIAAEYLNNPTRIQVAPPGKPVEKIQQALYFVPKSEKTVTLKRDLETHPKARAIVFARTKHGAERLMKSLLADGFKADSIHGNKSQGQRDRALRSFKEGETLVLVATDVAARGIDIPGVERVYNFDMPNVPENYVHRIGRTGRAGADGKAVSYVAPDELGMLKTIEKVMKFTIPVAGGTRPQEAMDPSKKSQRKRRIKRRSDGAGQAPEMTQDSLDTFGSDPIAPTNKPKAKRRFGAGQRRDGAPARGGKGKSEERSRKPRHKRAHEDQRPVDTVTQSEKPKSPEAGHETPKKPRQNAKQRAKSWSSGGNGGRNANGKSFGSAKGGNGANAGPNRGGNAKPQRRRKPSQGRPQRGAA